MKITKLFLAFCLLVFAASSFAQLSRTAPSPGNLDILDTKLISSDSRSDSASPDTTTTPTAGTYTLTLNINLVSTIPKSTKIVCLVQIQVTGDTLLSGIQQTAGAAATRSGNTASCTVQIPYSWNLGSPATDKFERIYSILAPIEATVGIPVPFNSGHLNLGSIAMPANGATTTETFAATL
jgi:hypothetical protein